MWQDRAYSSPPLGWYVSRARATWWIIGVTVAIHVGRAILSAASPETSEAIERWGMATYEGWIRFQLWRPFTYMLLHGGTQHILWNMLFLAVAGSLLEPQIGARAFLKIYVLSGVVGALSALVHPGGTIGASGAINGTLVALAVLMPNVTVLFMFLIPMRIKWIVAIFIAIDVLNVLSADNPGTDSVCHLLGAATGFSLTFVGPRLVSPWLARRRADRVREEQRARQVEAIDEEKELDRLLEKISREGMHSLTEAERRFLKKVSGKYQNARRD
jgi:membrane associated rhomboid family serine protease